MPPTCSIQFLAIKILSLYIFSLHWCFITLILHLQKNFGQLILCSSFLVPFFFQLDKFKALLSLLHNLLASLDWKMSSMLL